MACEHCGDRPGRPKFKARVHGRVVTAFGEFFDSLEADERVKDTQQHIFEVLVREMFVDEKDFWDYVNSFEREW